jgi:excisionase family DNA binding protein
VVGQRLTAGSAHPPTDNNCYTRHMARTARVHGHVAPQPEVMTIDDLALYLQLSKSSLYKLVQGGRIPGQKVGRHWRFHKAAIDGWLVSGKSGQPSGDRKRS